MVFRPVISSFDGRGIRLAADVAELRSSAPASSVFSGAPSGQAASVEQAAWQGKLAEPPARAEEQLEAEQRELELSHNCPSR